MLGNFRENSLKVYFYVFIAVTYLPLLLLILLSFNRARTPGFPLVGFTLEWWQRFFTSASAMNTVQNSFLIGSATAMISTALGLLAAFALVRHFFRGKNLANALVLLPLCLPPVVVAVGALVFLRTVLDLELSRLTIILGHTLLALPFTTLVLIARLIGFDRTLEEAAYDLGANEFTTFRKITLPIIMPGIFVALMMGFIISFEDVVVAYFLSGFDTTIPVLVFGLQRRATGLPMVTVISAFMVFIMVVFLIVSLVWARRVANN